MPRKKARMDIDHATRGAWEKRTGEDATESHHGAHVGASLLNPPGDLGCLEFLGLEDLQSVTDSHVDNRRRGHHLLPTDGFAGPRNDQ